LQQGPMLHHVRPSVDVLFESAVSAGRNALAVLLTGMGRDGAAGMLKLKQAAPQRSPRMKNLVSCTACPGPPWNWVPSTRYCRWI
jgi:hypothetical protein